MNKSTLITLLLVVALLVLGIAYAALAGQTLTVDGSATVVADNATGNFDVEFTSASVKSKLGNVTATAEKDPDNEDKASLVISNMTTKGESVVAEYVITNSSAAEDIYADLIVDVETIATNSEWLTTSASLSNGGEAIAPGETATLTVTVTLNQTPISDADATAASAVIKVDVDATPVHAS